MSGFWTSDNRSIAETYLQQNAGLSEIGARGLVERWAGVESGAAGPAAVNPTSGATGISQWLGSRQDALLASGDTSFTGQLSFAASELNTSERSAGDALRSASTPEEAARGASMFERAEGYNPATGTDNYTSTVSTALGGSTQPGGDTISPAGNSGQLPEGSSATDGDPNAGDGRPLTIFNPQQGGSSEISQSGNSATGASRTTSANSTGGIAQAITGAANKLTGTGKNIWGRSVVVILGLVMVAAALWIFTNRAQIVQTVEHAT